jgi:hypothetical protein
LLLVVLALLAMFGLSAIAFVVLSSQSRRTSLQQQRMEQQFDPPEALLYQMALQTIRGSNRPGSVLGWQSLLEDLYGNRSVVGTVGAVAAPAGGQFLSITPANTTWDTGDGPDCRVGSVLTMQTGPAAGMSFRIVAGNPQTAADPLGRLVICLEGSYPVLGPDGQPGRAGVGGFGAANSDDVVCQGNVFTVNGVPFTGTGFGNLDPGTQRLDALALLPNDPANANSQRANEGYDAIDHQNMLLALVLSTPSGYSEPFPVPVPSLHRPELINYWYHVLYNNPSTCAGFSWSGENQNQKWEAILRPWTVADPTMRNAIIDFKRRFILRPLRDDHPAFTGSNPLSTVMPNPQPLDPNEDPPTRWNLSSAWEISGRGTWTPTGTASRTPSGLTWDSRPGPWPTAAGTSPWGPSSASTWTAGSISTPTAARRNWPARTPRAFPARLPVPLLRRRSGFPAARASARPTSACTCSPPRPRLRPRPFSGAAAGGKAGMERCRGGWPRRG